MHMPILIYITLLGWIPFCLLLFAALPPQRAVVVGVIGGWLILPPAGIPLPGFPDYDKIMAPIVGVTLATLILQPDRLLAFRPQWFDLPAVMWCLCPLISSLTNSLGAYDGISSSVANVIRWALPYLIGRLYFGNKDGMRELAVGIAVGGIIWVLPCLFEIRMSPILLSKVYGIGRFVGFEGTRLGSWRPIVFFATGLELGMWMTASSLMTVWLWRCGSLKQLGRFSIGTWFLPVLLITTFFCRATGAFFLLIAGLMILWLSTHLSSKLLFCAFLLLPPLYYAVRIPNAWSGNELVEFIDTYVSRERASSLAYRFEKESLLTKRAMLQPIWGWGGWGRNRVVDEETGRDIAPSDGMWVIYLGYYGCVGLLTWTIMLLLPSWLFVLRYPVYQWRDPTVAPLAAMATLLGLYLIDCLANGFMNLSYVLAAGGLMGAVPTSGKSQLPSQNSTPDNKDAFPRGSATVPQERLADRYRQLARTLKTQGLPAEAKVMLTHAFDLLTKLTLAQPDMCEFQRQRWDCANDLAWLLLSAPPLGMGEPLLAVDLAIQATEADAQSATYWNTLGAAYHCAGDPAGAILALERSMALSSGGTVFDYVFLSLAYSQMGQQVEACRWLAQADSWLEHHASTQPELVRLIDQARGGLMLARTTGCSLRGEE
jgi:hypothetical protein